MIRCVVGSRPLAVRGLGRPLLPEGAPLASTLSGTAADTDVSVWALIRVLASAACWPSGLLPQVGESGPGQLIQFVLPLFRCCFSLGQSGMNNRMFFWPV